jgi:hypothetical protein
MTDGILLTGKRGSGKSLIAVSFIRDYMERGCEVATNLNIHVQHLVNPKNKVRPFRLPDFPTADDLMLLPLGNPGLERREGDIAILPGYTETKNGLLVLDEVATFLNSRDWQEKTRRDLISWLLQSRKFGWDIIMIAQHARLVDAQVRNSLFDLFGVVRRLDKINIPVLGNLFKIAGLKLKMPKLHVCAIRYGDSPSAVVAERFFVKGDDLYQAYDTTQKIDPHIGVKTGEGFSYLSAYDTKGRFLGFWEMYKSAIIAALISGLVIGLIIGLIVGRKKEVELMQVPTIVEKYSDIPAIGLYRDNGKITVFVNGAFQTPEVYKETIQGWEVKINNTWHKGK